MQPIPFWEATANSELTQLTCLRQKKKLSATETGQLKGGNANVDVFCSFKMLREVSVCWHMLLTSIASRLTSAYSRSGEAMRQEHPVQTTSSEDGPLGLPIAEKRVERKLDTVATTRCPV